MSHDTDDFLKYLKDGIDNLEKGGDFNMDVLGKCLKDNLPKDISSELVGKTDGEIFSTIFRIMIEELERNPDETIIQKLIDRLESGTKELDKINDELSIKHRMYFDDYFADKLSNSVYIDPLLDSEEQELVMKIFGSFVDHPQFDYTVDDSIDLIITVHASFTDKECSDELWSNLLHVLTPIILHVTDLKTMILESGITQEEMDNNDQICQNFLYMRHPYPIPRF